MGATWVLIVGLDVDFDLCHHQQEIKNDLIFYNQILHDPEF